MALFYKVYWRKQRRALRLLDFDAWPATPSTTAQDWPAWKGYDEIRVNFDRILQRLDTPPVYPAAPEPAHTSGKIGPRVPGHFQVYWRKQRGILLIPEHHLYPVTPPKEEPPEISWFTHFEPTKNQTNRKFRSVNDKDTLWVDKKPPAPEQPPTAFLAPVTNRRHGRVKLQTLPTLSYFYHPPTNYEWISWRIVDTNGDPITGGAPTLIVRDLPDRQLYDWDTGTFKSSGHITLKQPMSETDATNLPGFYEIALNIINFNGRYQMIAQDEVNNKYSESEMFIVDGYIWDDNVTTDVAAVLSDTDTTIPAQISALNDLSSADVAAISAGLTTEQEDMLRLMYKMAGLDPTVPLIDQWNASTNTGTRKTANASVVLEMVGDPEASVTTTRTV